ncbi:MAG: PIN domain-containing protein [Longimicrobiales bacterium]|nr:PIN domain-containing protein [Longimicrobiales bacterium]
MAAELFVDTSAWYPLADPSHPDHADLAGELTERVRAGTRIVTTNLVVAETHALLLRRVGRDGALRFLREVRREPLLVEPSTPDLERRAAEEWLARFEDQDFSLTDAVSFTVMSDRGITESLTLDRHFAVAGFTMVPAPSR